MATATAKVFMNGNSQAIRLPKEFRVEGKEVYIKKEKQGIYIFPMEQKRESFKKALDGMFGCCPDFDTDRKAISGKPRKVNL
jgi:antitoxin VapB